MKYIIYLTMILSSYVNAEDNKKMLESIDNRLKSIEIGKIESLKESRFLEFEEEDLDKESEKWFETFQYSEYLEDDYVKLSKDYMEDKIDDPHFNEILDTPIINYYKHLNDGNDYEVVNYAYFKYLKPNDFKMVFDEIQKKGTKNIKGFDFYLLKSKNDLKKFTITYCDYPTTCKSKNHEHRIYMNYINNQRVTGHISSKNDLDSYFIINKEGYLFIYNKLDENGNQRFGLEDPKLMMDRM